MPAKSPDTASPEDIARRDDLLRSHAKALREHVRALGEKAYWNAFDVAPDFVVAFIPNEALLQAALEADPTLMMMRSLAKWRSPRRSRCGPC